MRQRVIAIILLVIAIAGCSSHSPAVEYIFPNGFHGLAVIAEDKEYGLEIRPVDGKYTFEIPRNGKLVVKDLAPFNRWHKDFARYSNGEKIPDMTSTNNANNGFYGLGTVRSVQGLGGYYFVGSKEEYDALSKTKDLREIPLATKISVGLPADAK